VFIRHRAVFVSMGKFIIMITQLKIENYKSIQELTLDVGRVNVLIGENGCGKSNILEAITFAAAAEANDLKDNSLEIRGIRLSNPELMRSAFEKTQQEKIKITLHAIFNKYYILKNENDVYSEWVLDKTLENEMLKIFNVPPPPDTYCEIEGDEDICEQTNDETHEEYAFRDIMDKFQKFIIYSPENSILRDFSLPPKIKPLGDKGEGLLNLLIYTQYNAHKSQKFSELNDIQETLALFGWFEAIKIPDDFSLLNKKITLQDRYLALPFDHRSANEGFLLVLFYITLVVSKYTPKIFAIDNIDTSLNPKLCSKLIEELARLAKKYDKQIFLTSHNPAILDGIDLGDEEGQRLFVVSRNREGRTRCKRITIENKPKSSIRDRLSRVLNENENYTKQDVLALFDNSKEPVKLSEAFLRGYLGGLPKGF